MNNIQQAMFFDRIIAATRAQLASESLTGSRVLKPHLDQIRAAVKMGADNRTIATALSPIVSGLSVPTLALYVGQVCREHSLRPVRPIVAQLPAKPRVAPVTAKPTGRRLTKSSFKNGKGGIAWLTKP